jgi:hypothetical protein
MFDIMYKLAYKKDVRYNNNNMIYMEGKMKTVFELCKPRESVFVDTTRDDVLNLRNLIENNIDIDKFFDENFMTKGMEILLTTAFKRFKGESETGVIKLTQAMGGGKTHNMLALALLAKNKEWRRKILGKEFDNIGDIKVIAFSGRESDAPYGIWGSLAEQLGKKEVFKDLYTPLKAPGEKAWISLLQGEKTLILFDELPPYLENAKSITVGNSDLCQVTVTALSNLFSALGTEQLSNVCLVFSDLKATYESGSQMLQSSFEEAIEKDVKPVAAVPKPDPKPSATKYVTGQFGIKPPLSKVAEHKKPYSTSTQADEEMEEFVIPEISEGDAVKHKSFGDGIVTKLDKAGKHIRVKFAVGEKLFLFPDAFKQGYLKL